MDEGIVPLKWTLYLSYTGVDFCLVGYIYIHITVIMINIVKYIYILIIMINYAIF